MEVEHRGVHVLRDPPEDLKVVWLSQIFKEADATENIIDNA